MGRTFSCTVYYTRDICLLVARSIHEHACHGQGYDFDGFLRPSLCVFRSKFRETLHLSVLVALVIASYETRSSQGDVLACDFVQYTCLISHSGLFWIPLGANVDGALPFLSSGETGMIGTERTERYSPHQVRTHR